jgi:hypothetical protein
MSRREPPKIRSLPAAKQRQLDTLLEKNVTGKITAKERAKLTSLVEEAEDLMVANSQRLADFVRNQALPPPATAVPVTVWVTPQATER